MKTLFLSCSALIASIFVGCDLTATDEPDPTPSSSYKMIDSVPNFDETQEDSTLTVISHSTTKALLTSVQLVKKSFNNVDYQYFRG